jgi:hypothetical protein
LGNTCGSNQQRTGGSLYGRACGMMQGFLLAVGALVLAAAGPDAAEAADGRIFVIGNYPVEATASDAVKAKEQAIQDGQQAAFRSLLKRIVPVTAYGRLKQIKTTPAGGLIEGFSVRSERNSSTQYIASYDFSFQPEAVQRLLDGQGIPYLDKQAPRIVIVPIYRAGSQPANVVAEATDTWTYAWRGLDLVNTLTPVTLAEAKREIHADTLQAAVEGDSNAHRVIAGEYRTSLVVLAVLEPSADGKKATVTLSGQDSVGNFTLVRAYRLDGDLAYAAELAAVVGLGVLEGRWKAANAHLMTASAPASYGRGGVERPDTFGAPQPDSVPQPGSTFGSGPSSYPTIGSGSLLRLSVSFRGMSEWQQISQRLTATPGVDNVEVEGLSARGARIALSYPGGPDALARALSAQGLSLRNGPDGLLLSAR